MRFTENCFCYSYSKESRIVCTANTDRDDMVWHLMDGAWVSNYSVRFVCKILRDLDMLILMTVFEILAMPCLSLFPEKFCFQKKDNAPYLQNLCLFFKATRIIKEKLFENFEYFSLLCWLFFFAEMAPCHFEIFYFSQILQSIW